jgi:DNA-binding MarR family transcriptional regulator
VKTSELYDHLSDVTLELAWRQWTAIGVAGTRSSRRTIVDPEALLLATLSIGRSDARLFDEALDWVAVNAQLLDMARLRRLGKRATSDQHRLLGVVAQVAIDHGAKSGFNQIAWAGVLAQEEKGTYAGETLFRSHGEDAPAWVNTDAQFAQAGFLRSSPELRGMSRAPDATQPACLRFRARSLVGLGARAEVLTYLWTHEWAHGRLIAERAAYNQAPVAEYLSSLAASGLAERRTDGRRTLYRLAEGLRAVAAPGPAYADWVRAWPALVALLDALRPGGLSEPAGWVRLAEALDSQRDGLVAEGVDADIGELRGWAETGSGCLASAVKSVVARVRQLAE